LIFGRYPFLLMILLVLCVVVLIEVGAVRSVTPSSYISDRDPSESQLELAFDAFKNFGIKWVNSLRNQQAFTDHRSVFSISYFSDCDPSGSRTWDSVEYIQLF